jgi:predicted nucleotidyltransferase component of viral defense system
VEREDYFTKLYSLQDAVLASFATTETEFYLTGGTAASRGYLNHRLSDDLDLFVNDDSRFGLWADRLIASVADRPEWDVQVGLRDLRFVRFSVANQELTLKVELVNDVPSRVGQVSVHAVLGRLDTAENILANKLTALTDREEPKDLADVWGFCVRMGLSVTRALEGAHGKAAGLFPVDLARPLLRATTADWELVRWIEAPPVDDYLKDLRRLGEELVLVGPGEKGS